MAHTYNRDCSKCNNCDDTEYDAILCKMSTVHGIFNDKKRIIKYVPNNTSGINLDNFVPIDDKTKKCTNCNISNLYYYYKTNTGLFTTNKIICNNCYNGIKTYEYNRLQRAKL